MRTYSQKITFWLRCAGWLCLLPASLCLYFSQLMRGSSVAWIFLSMLVIVVLFAVYLLTTAKSDRWRYPRNLIIVTVLSFFFISVIVSVPLYMAYLNCRKLK